MIMSIGNYPETLSQIILVGIIHISREIGHERARALAVGRAA